MPYPLNWPPLPASGSRSIRFFKSETATTDYADNAFIFIDDVGANTYTVIPTVRYGDVTSVINIGAASPGSTNAKQVCANTIQVTNDGAVDISISFDGTNEQGIVKVGETVCWRDRREAGIALKVTAGTCAYRAEAW